MYFMFFRQKQSKKGGAFIKRRISLLRSIFQQLYGTIFSILISGFMINVQPCPPPLQKPVALGRWKIANCFQFWKRLLACSSCLLLLFWGILCWLNKTDTKVAKGQRRLKVINFGIFGTCEKIEEFWRNFTLKPKLCIPSTILGQARKGLVSGSLACTSSKTEILNKIEI